ncbi:hypothetical protein ACIA49_07655 [Kribbella sp. NPDC051587]
MKWFRRRKKRAPDDERQSQARPRQNEVKDLRARLTSDGYTLKH